MSRPAPVAGDRLATAALFQVRLGETSLCLADRDLAALVGCDPECCGPDLSEEATRHEVLLVTDGVLALVAAALEERRLAPTGPHLSVAVARSAWSSDDGPGPLVTTAQAWAGRIEPALRTVPTSLVAAFLPNASPRSVAVLAERVLGREVDVDEVHALVALPGTHVTDAGHVTLPPVLAAAVVRLTALHDPLLVSRTRHEITVECLLADDSHLAASVRIGALAGVRAWAELDAYLSTGAPYVAVLTRAHRRALAELVPADIPAGWPHLRRVRELLVDGAAGSRELPQPWLELALLTSTTRETGLSETVRQIRDRSVAALSQVHAADPRAVDASFSNGLAWMRAEVGRLHREAARRYVLSYDFVDEIGLLCLVLLGACDGAMALGRGAVAQETLTAVASLAEACTLFPGSFAVVQVGLVPRQALVAAWAGLPGTAEERLRQCAAVVAATGAREPGAERAAVVARRLLADASPVPVRANPDVVLVDEVAPFEVEAEALLVLVQRGPEAAARWLTDCLRRARWTNVLQFEWWPVRGILALLDLREGRVEQARARLTEEYLPADVVTLVEADAALVEGRGEDCLAMLAGLDADVSLAPRWTLMAQGLRLGALRATGDGSRAEQQAQLRARAWREAPAVAALRPEDARLLVLPLLEPEAAVAEGLIVYDAVGVVTLTPRQLDVLERIAAGATLPEIATELYLGVQTVRSTSKALYKRLGVHDRDAAVRTAQRLGLIEAPADHDEETP